MRREIARSTRLVTIMRGGPIGASRAPVGGMWGHGRFALIGMPRAAKSPRPPSES